jgi:hypothetical protein
MCQNSRMMARVVTHPPTLASPFTNQVSTDAHRSIEPPSIDADFHLSGALSCLMAGLAVCFQGGGPPALSRDAPMKTNKAMEHKVVDEAQ